MPKYTKTGKLRCCRCLKIATHKLEAGRGSDKTAIYHCVEHTLSFDVPLLSNPCAVEECSEDRLERQVQAFLESTALHRDDPLF